MIGIATPEEQARAKDLAQRDAEQKQAARLEGFKSSNLRAGDIVTRVENGRKIWMRFDGEKFWHIAAPRRKKGQTKPLKVMNLANGEKVYLHPTKGWRRDVGAPLRPRHIRRMMEAA